MTATRRLAAIFAADVAGYSRLMGGDEEGTLAALKAIRRELVDPKIAEHRGRIVKTTGDGLLVEFASVVDAVRCAVEMQRAMAERNADVAGGAAASNSASASISATSSSTTTTSTATASTSPRGSKPWPSPAASASAGTVRDQVRDKLDLRLRGSGRAAGQEHRPAGACLPHPDRRTYRGAGRSRRRAPSRYPPPGGGRLGTDGDLYRAAARTGSAARRLRRGLRRARADCHARRRAWHRQDPHRAGTGGPRRRGSGGGFLGPVQRRSRRAALLAVGADPRRSAARPRSRSSRRPRHDRDDIADIVPEIRDLLPGLEPSARLATRPRPGFGCSNSIRQFFASLGRRRPLLLVLDDLHWADAPSLAPARIPRARARRQPAAPGRAPTGRPSCHASTRCPNALGGLARAPHVDPHPPRRA